MDSTTTTTTTTGGTTLHIVMLPWLAMGHLLPFLNLSQRLARMGHRISFLTTPSNIKSLLPKIPPSLSLLIHFVELRMPVPNPLPDGVENTVDITSDHLRPHLDAAFANFQPQLSNFLDHARPDWVIYDYTAGWAPTVAAKYSIPCTFFSLVSAAILAFFGPPGKVKRASAEDFTNVPDWIPFPTTIAYRLHEARQFFNLMGDADVSTGIDACPFVVVRSCNEFEQEWIELVSRLYGKPVIPVSLLPPSASQDEESWSGDLVRWLDKKVPNSVVYAAFGSEAKLTVEQVREVALGLELSGLPFVWALRVGSPPRGFEERTAGQGMVCRDWVQQHRILGHEAVGGFLTHGGWNSIVEGLSFGVAMAVLPLQFDQGLNARYIVEKGCGVEVEKDEEDGSFTGDGIAKSLRLVMVEEEGEGIRVKAKECKKLFGVDNQELHDKCVDDCVKFFLKCKPIKG